MSNKLKSDLEEIYNKVYNYKKLIYNEIYNSLNYNVEECSIRYYSYLNAKIELEKYENKLLVNLYRAKKDKPEPNNKSIIIFPINT